MWELLKKIETNGWKVEILLKKWIGIWRKIIKSETRILEKIEEI